MTDDLLEALYQANRGLILHTFDSPIKGYLLDLDLLPQELKTAFIRWMIQVNADRLKSNVEPIMTLELALRCPVWKVVRCPIRRVELTKEGLFNQPGVKTASKSPRIGSINKRSR